MKIYYIKNNKCVDVIDKVKHFNKIMVCATPMLMSGERLIDYYCRLSHGNIGDIGLRVMSQYILLCQDTIKAFPHYFLGDVTNVKFYSDAMNLLIASIK